MLIYVHRNSKVYLGRGDHDGHLDFHTAPELCVRERERGGGGQGWREMYAQLRCENEWVELKMCHIHCSTKYVHLITSVEHYCQCVGNSCGKITHTILQMIHGGCNDSPLHTGNNSKLLFNNVRKRLLSSNHHEKNQLLNVVCN